MKFQEMLTAEMSTITDGDIKNSAYAIQYADLTIGSPGYRRQQELKARLNEIEAAKKARLKALRNQLPGSENDPYCDEYAYS